MTHERRVYMVAGEASGDLLGARLMTALRAQSPGVEITGVGGEAMTAAGLASLFPMHELSIMGIFELIPHIPRIFRRLREVERDVLEKKPDVVVTIDSPGFNFRLAKRLRTHGIRVVHVGAPTVWAWRPGRAKKVAAYLDHLLTLYPFEPSYFTKHGLKTTFIGHPLTEMGLETIDGKAFRRRHKINPHACLVALLPGSRGGEIDRLLPIFLGALDRAEAAGLVATYVLPTLPVHLDRVRQMLSAAGRDDILCVEGDEKYGAMAASTMALAASGTVSIELALLSVPMIIAYRISALTGFLMKFLIKTPYFSMINIMAGRACVPELIQEKAEAGMIAESLLRLNTDGAQGAQRKAMTTFVAQLRASGVTPSALAAQVILGADQA